MSYHVFSFCVVIGKESLELRRLSDAMTDYYYHKCRHRAGEMDRNYREGDIVAAPFHWNGKMLALRLLIFLRNIAANYKINV